MEERFNKDEAVKRFEEMLSGGKNYFFDLQDFLDIIDFYITTGNFIFAYKAIQYGLNQYENNTAILLFKAELLALEEKTDEAQKVINLIKELDPGEKDLPVLEADIFSRMDKHEEAIKSLQNALKINGQDPEIYDLMTIEYLYLDDYQNALKMAMESLQLEPENQTALYNAITCYDLMDENKKALKFLLKYVDEYPLSEIGWSLLGKRYIETDDYEKAVRAFDFAIAIDDKFLGAYFDKAYALTKLSLYEKAIEFYKLTLSLSDPSAFTYYHIAKNYELLNDFKNANNYYEKAIYEDPGHYKSWLKLVALLIKADNIDAALQKSYEAVQVIPTQELFEQQAQILLLKNEEKDAIKALEMSLKFGVLQIPVILLLSDLYRKNNQIEKFRQLMLEAKELYPESKEIQKRMTGKA